MIICNRKIIQNNSEKLPEPNLPPCGIEPHQTNSTNHSAICTNGGSKIFEKNRRKAGDLDPRLEGEFWGIHTLPNGKVIKAPQSLQTIAVKMWYELPNLETPKKSGANFEISGGSTNFIYL
jgi:hypothetical protein